MPYIQKTLAAAYAELGKKRIAPADADLLLAHCLGKDSAFVCAHPEFQLTQEQQLRFNQLIQRRIAGYSVAVLVGYKYFYGLRFSVTAETLVPRPETELLVEQALEYLTWHGRSSVLDIGTGCGNIIVALATKAHPEGRHGYHATDVSTAALRVARENARTHRASVRFSQSNLFSNLGRKKFNLIVTNLPYLTTRQLHEPSIRKEPVGALWGGSNGTDLYAALLRQVPDHLERRFCILLEIDPHQKNELRELAAFLLPCLRRPGP